MSATRFTVLLADIWRCSVNVVLQTGMIVKTLSFGFMVRRGDTRNAIRTVRAVPAAKEEHLASAGIASLCLQT